MKKLVRQELNKILKKYKWKSINDIGWGWGDIISAKEVLSEDFIREFQDELDWWWVANKQILSENLMRELQDKINWEECSIFQKFSEDFMREFKDKIDWFWASRNQNFPSYNFIYEFRDYLYLDILLERGIITDKDMRNIWKPINRFDLIDIE